MAEGGMNGQQGNLCKAGCGFYGSELYEGMCSKCHKESVEQNQANSLSPNPSTHMASVRDVVSSVTSAGPSEALAESMIAVDRICPTLSEESVDDIAKSNIEASNWNSTASAVVKTADDDPVDDPSGEEEGRPKKKRCQKCRKKLGLTAIMCRCGSYFCGEHVYSDRHDCTYNFQEEGKMEIQKKNPAIVNPKVRHI